MEKVLVDKQTFMKIKSDLRGERIRFRDCGTTIVVPKFDEAITVKSVCRNGTPPSLAAYHLLKQSNIANGCPYKWTVPEMRLLDIKPPVYYNPSSRFVQGYKCHVDIQSSYYQFYRHLSWRGRWPTKKTRYHICDTFDSLSDWKAARNAVVGIARSTKEIWDTGGNREYIKKAPNPFLSPYLWGCLMAIHHYIAEMAITWGAIYYDTDGAIFSNQYRSLHFREWLGLIGIKYNAIEDQEGVIRGWQSWKIGQVERGNVYNVPGKFVSNVVVDNPNHYKIFNTWLERSKQK